MPPLISAIPAVIAWLLDLLPPVRGLINRMLRRDLEITVSFPKRVKGELFTVPSAVTTWSHVIIRFDFMVTNLTDAKRFRIRGVSFQFWKSDFALYAGKWNTFSVLDAKTSEPIDFIVEGLKDSEKISAYVYIPMTARTLYWLLHPEDPKVYLVLDRVDGFGRRLYHRLPTEKWHSAIRGPESKEAKNE